MQVKLSGVPWWDAKGYMRQGHFVPVGGEITVDLTEEQVTALQADKWITVTPVEALSSSTGAAAETAATDPPSAAEPIQEAAPAAPVEVPVREEVVEIVVEIPPPPAQATETQAVQAATPQAAPVESAAVEAAAPEPSPQAA